MNLPDRHLLLGKTLGALCATALAFTGPGMVIDTFADEFLNEVVAPGFDASKLVFFEDRPYEVTYHARSQRWLVRNINTGEQDDFGSLDTALARLSELRGLPIIDTALLPAGPDYQGRIRAVLDLSTAPDAFGWLLFWADDWSAESDWKTWTLRP